VTYFVTALMGKTKSHSKLKQYAWIIIFLILKVLIDIFNKTHIIPKATELIQLFRMQKKPITDTYG